MPDFSYLLQNTGLKITPKRLQFLEILTKQKSYTMKELREMATQEIDMNIVTFYRILSDLEENWLIHLIHSAKWEPIIFLCHAIVKKQNPSKAYKITYCSSCWNIQDEHMHKKLPQHVSYQCESIYLKECPLCKL